MILFAHDAKVVAANMLHGNEQKPNYRGVPSVAFTIPPIASVERLKRDLARLGKEAEVAIYPGATHGFFCDDRPSSYDPEAASDAWKRLLTFFAAHLQR